MNTDNVERLWAHLDVLEVYLQMLRDDLRPTARPEVPAHEVMLGWELFIDGAWRSVVTMDSADGSIFFRCVARNINVGKDEMVVARPVR